MFWFFFFTADAFFKSVWLRKNITSSKHIFIITDTAFAILGTSAISHELHGKMNMVCI